MNSRVRRFRAARSPLMNRLRRAVSDCKNAKANGIPLDEWIDQRQAIQYQLSRRKFIKLATAGLITTPFLSKPIFADEKISNANIVIVGAGIAGLTTAYNLKKNGISSQIYEASSRVGGRILTRYGLFGANTAAEAGGEFIDSNHADLLSLIDELGLEIVDKSSGRITTPAYFFENHFISAQRLASELSSIVEQVTSDDNGLEEDVNFRRPGRARYLDNLSVDQYLDRIGARNGLTRKIIESAYVTEYGLELNEQSALNFIFMFVDNDSEGPIDIFGESDERFKVVGGNGQIAEQLSKHLVDQLHPSHKLVAISRKANRYALTFEVASSKLIDVPADFIVLTLPFKILREVDIRVELPDFKRYAIKNLGYGTSTKVLVGANSKPWARFGLSGETFTDKSFQLAWENTVAQPTNETGVTFFLGGENAVHAGRMDTKVASCLYKTDFMQCYKTEDLFNDKAEKFHWPGFPYAKASFSAYKPGQWTTIADAEFIPVDNIYFAGEHCSRGAQGMMNGAVETGRQVAEMIVQKLT